MQNLILWLFQTTINVGPFWHYLKFPLKYVLFSLHNKKVICLSHCLKKKMRKTAVSWHFHQSYFFRNNMLFFFLPFSSLSGWLEHKLSIISSVTIFIFCFFSKGDSFFFLQIKIDDFVFRLLFKQSFMGLLVVSVVYCFGNDLQMQFI